MNGQIPPEIRRRAWEWLETQAESASDAHIEALTDWLKEDPRHLHAYLEYQEIVRNIDTLSVSAEGKALREESFESSDSKEIEGGTRLALGAWFGSIFKSKPVWAFASVAASAILLVLIRQPDISINHLNYHTEIGEIHTLKLADSSKVTLGGNSQFESSISKDQRTTRLLSGEAFFEVASDPEVPFLVQLDQAVVRVVGTQFSVNRSERRIKVSVSDGFVEVSGVKKEGAASTQKPEVVVLHAGQKVVRTATQGFGEVTSLPTSDVGSWRTGWLSYKSEPLIDVVSDVNRYFKGEIVIGEKSLNQVPVTLSISTSDIAALPQMLAASLPLKIVKETKNRFVLLSKPEKQSD